MSACRLQFYTPPYAIATNAALQPKRYARAPPPNPGMSLPTSLREANATANGAQRHCAQAVEDGLGLRLINCFSEEASHHAAQRPRPNLGRQHAHDGRLRIPVLLDVRPSTPPTPGSATTQRGMTNRHASRGMPHQNPRPTWSLNKRCPRKRFPSPTRRRP